ncbi:GAF domain-containing protein [Limnoraphis robusta]|uniref:histidine kinase n=1 Tax=Limnoraphis robusta CCNP1315 TaxID=3110306 RepID=A0ABU5U6W4_9CYAN|nr:GAF domain-containing protein [Limnoraphis robusta]MEA5522790.1 GAF domain-containing protein [Limnoraphis robusta CCNP1315]MEA5543747.1 GAF domain-containing protein [Limnoraphis robusta CCNP1324]
MMLNAHQWEQIRECCKNQAAFERLQQILSEQQLPCQLINDQSSNSAHFQCQIHPTERYRALFRVISRIRESLDLNTIFTATAIEVRQLLNADRVAVFRFDPDSGYDQGEFISEDINPEFKSVLTAQVYDHCFGEQFAPQYQQGRINAIADIYTAGLSNCHIEILSQFQVRANLFVPLLKGGKLWGGLCIHQCSSPRNWSENEIEFVTQIAHHFDVALQQVEYIEQVQHQAQQLALIDERHKGDQRHQILFEMVNRIRQSLDMQTIFDTATEEVRQFLNSDRVVVYRFNPDWSGYFVAESVSSEWELLIDRIPTIADTCLQETNGGRFRQGELLAIEDIYKAEYSDCQIKLLEQFHARAYIVVPILQGEILWGLLAAYQNTAPRSWKNDELQLLAQIGIQLGVALQQAELLAETKALAENLKQAQIQLVQTEKMSSLGHLVAGIAHEINNPVNFIYGNLDPATDFTQDILDLVQLYQQEYSQPTAKIEEKISEIELDYLSEDLPKILSSMRLGAERIRQLVLSLRNFSRLDEAEVKAVDIHEGIDSTLLILHHRLKSKSERSGIELIKNYGELPKVECYAAQLNQVFMNILSNALDALESVDHQSEASFLPRITIKTAVIQKTDCTPKNWVMISIQDNAGGIPPEVKNKIFDPFFTTKPVGKGTGLGLSISYQIVVEKHKGILQCESQLGQGTEFKIQIPVKHS